MSGLLDLVFVVSLAAFIVFWWKKRKARLAAGDNYEQDAAYQKISRQKCWSGIVCIVSLVLGVVSNYISDGAETIDGIKNLFSLIGFVALIAFVYYWRKKTSARKAAGDNYQADENYLRISKIKRLIGGVCVVSLVLSVAVPNSPAELQKQEALRAKYQAEEAQKQAELANNAEDIIREAIQINQPKDESIKGGLYLFDYEKSDAEKDIKKKFKSSLKDALRKASGFGRFDVDDDLVIKEMDVHVPKGGYAQIKVQFKWNKDNNPMHKTGYTTCTYAANINPDRSWRIIGPAPILTKFND